MKIRQTLLTAVLLLGCCGAALADYDVVIRGGRVMDPESGLDAVRDVGIFEGRITAISEVPLSGADEVIDAKGLVLAPGFIDLHQHAQDDESLRLKVRDGVTAAMELEIGTDDVAEWYRARDERGKSLIHYGVSIGHVKVRMRVMGDFPGFLPQADSKAATVTASAEQIEAMKKGIQHGLNDGAVAVGFGITYTPVATEWEVLEMFRAAGQAMAPCHVHIRERGPDSVRGVQEVMAAAAVTGAPLQIVHTQATGGDTTPKLLQMIGEARQQGMDVTAEIYPYIAGMTDISSAIFADGWRESTGWDYDDLQWGATGEKLTAESFAKYRAQGGLVIVFSNREEVVVPALQNENAMIASDGLVGHPRNAGTFARVLGHYVRERGDLELMEALRKITLMPAQRLENRTPMMKNKGRVKVGADADLTLFDPEKVIDVASFTDASQPSSGIPFVLVGGKMVVRDGEIVERVFPGKAIRAPLGK
jgi:dihydroorotase